MKKLTICMYGAASNAIDPSYISAGENLGYEIGRRKHRMIYGGGSSGLMGACARGMKSANGEIIGVVPTFMDKVEPIFYDCTKLIRTETMAQRKEIMENQADAFIICPGGVGTMDEFFQIITLAQLHRKQAPIIIYNINGFYDNLIQFIRQSIEAGFINEDILDYFHIGTSPVKIIDEIERTL